MSTTSDPSNPILDRYPSVAEWLASREAMPMAVIPGNSPLQPRSANTSTTSPPADGTNWIGLLGEYRAAHPDPSGIDYQERCAPNGQFTCTVVIKEYPTPLGDPNAAYTRKKDAKKAAAHAAVAWLRSNNFMPPDGVTFPKPKPTPPPPKPKSAITSPTAGSSTSTPQPGTPSAAAANGAKHGQRVVELCLKLGFNMPSYRLSAEKDAPAIWSGWAEFHDPRVEEGRVGEVRQVYGKANAREAVAEGVVRFLESVLADRIERIRVREEERKRGNEGGGERAGKEMRVGDVEI